MSQSEPHQAVNNDCNECLIRMEGFQEPVTYQATTDFKVNMGI